jgi:large subunit ribosomal protein L32
MAVPKQRTSKARRDKRRSHHALKAPNISKCPECEDYRMSHRACPTCGFYKTEEYDELKLGR